MKWYLASYPSYCYLTLRRIKFQQFFICALCHVYFNNPSWKCKIISGGKHVIYLNADGAGTEQPVEWGEFNVPACSPWRCWCGRTWLCLGATPHTPQDLPAPHSCAVSISPLFCSGAPASQGFSHIHQAESLVFCMLLPKKPECLFAVWSKNGSLGLNILCYSQESRIHLLWESSFKSHGISTSLHCCLS